MTAEHRKKHRIFRKFFLKEYLIVTISDDPFDRFIDTAEIQHSASITIFRSRIQGA